MNSSQPLLVGISGGSGSGKTTFARMLNQFLNQKHGEGTSAILAQDHYYIDQSAKFRGDGDPAVNFDHPSAIEFSLLAKHLEQLKIGKAIEVPIYDFVTHTRKHESTPFAPRPIIIVDGMLLLSQALIRPWLDHGIFVDAPEEIRYSRRLKRDVVERGRTPEGVEKQFKAQVKPMHDQFIEPSIDFASQVVSGVNPFEPIIEAFPFLPNSR
jgi:uridine kinase